MLYKRCSVCSKLYSNLTGKKGSFHGRNIFEKALVCSIKCYQTIRRINHPQQIISCSGKICVISIDKKNIFFDKNKLQIVSKNRLYIDSIGYPSTSINRHVHRLHSILLPKKNKGFVIDHINRNKLDNRLCNLRYITQQANSLNNGKDGVYYCKKQKKWIAQIKKVSTGKRGTIGSFHTFREAKNAKENYIKNNILSKKP